MSLSLIYFAVKYPAIEIIYTIMSGITISNQSSLMAPSQKPKKHEH